MSDPFKHFKIRQKKTYKDPLLNEEIKLLRDLYDRHECPYNEQQSLKCFLFMIYTSLRLSDAKRFDPKKHIDGDDIVMHPKKVDYTGKQVRIPLTKESRELIGESQGKIFILCTDQKINEHLKSIASRVGINKRLTTRVARDTFATLFIERGGHVVALRDIMGHEKLETTMIYTRIRPRHIKEQMKVMEGLGT